ncbi:ABC transporter substrate-binding protein [Sinomonas soli]
MVKPQRLMMGAAAVFSCAVALTACGGGPGAKSGSGNESTYDIGVLVSQTGSGAQLGQGELQGAQLAADYVNKKGGVNGHQIKIVSADDKSTPDQALQQARTLISQKVAAVVGPSLVGSCQAVAPLMAANGPVDYCLSPAVNPKGYQWSASATAQALADEAMKYWKSKGITSIAVVSSTDASGTTGASAANAAAKAAGINVTANVTYDPASVSVTSQLQQAVAGKPQALVIWSTGTPAGVALKGLQQLGIDLPVMTTDGNLANTFLDRIKDYTPKTLLIPATRDFWWNSQPNGPAADLEKKYHDDFSGKFGSQPDFGPGVAYDAVLLIAEALKKAGSADPSAVKTALEGVSDFEGVVGTYNMSANDHRGINASDVKMVQAKDGKFVSVDQ